MDIAWYQQIGTRIARLRDRAGMTQQQLADRVGVGASYIARIESGTRRPTLDVLAGIGDGLGVPLHRLVVDERAVRSGAGQDAWGRAGRTLAGVLLDLDDADIELLLKIATRIRGRGTRPRSRPSARSTGLDPVEPMPLRQ